MSEPKSILDKAVLVCVKFSSFGNSKRVREDSVTVKVTDEKTGETDADRQLIRVTKSLLASPELDAIRKLQAEIRQYVYSVSVPSFAMEGVHFLSKDAIETVEAKFRLFSEQLNQLVANAKTAYPTRVQEIAERPGSAYNPDDYPSAEEFAASFGFTWHYLSLGVPDDLPQGLKEREQKAAEERVHNASSQIRQLLRQNFSDIIAHCLERLSGERENGKVKIIRQTTLDNWRAFLDGFAFRNLTEDHELAALVAEAKDILSDVTAEDLRTVDEIRDNVRAGFESIKARLGNLLKGKPQ